MGGIPYTMSKTYHFILNLTQFKATCNYANATVTVKLPFLLD